jgi:O-antigen/teichoic acid export membrane protein
MAISSAKSVAALSTVAALLRVLALGSQYALAWLLVPSEFGLVAMSQSVLILATTIGQGGIRQVLVQRPHAFRAWMRPAIGLSCFQAVAIAVAVILSAPVAASYFGEPIIPTLLICSLPSVVAQMLSAAPIASLQIDQEFGTIARINLINGVVGSIGSILMALVGCGVYSIVIPRAVAEVAACILTWRASNLGINPSYRPRIWGNLLRRGLPLQAGLMLFGLVMQMPVLYVGKIFDATAAGLFSFAWSISVQAVSLIVPQIDSVLVIKVAKNRGDLATVAETYRKVTSAISVILIPLCWFQASIVDAGIQLLFPEKWWPAGTIAEVLCWGAALFAVAIPGGSVIIGLGKPKLYCMHGAITLSICSALFGMASIIGVEVSKVPYVFSLLLLYAAFSTAYIAANLTGLRTINITQYYIKPTIVSGIAAQASITIQAHIMTEHPYQILAILSGAGAFLVIGGGLAAISIKKELLETYTKLIAPGEPRFKR